MEDCKTVRFPFPRALRLNTEDGERLEDPEVFRRMIGKFLYLNMTKPDIAYVVQQLSQFLGDPRKPHLNAAMHVLRYLKGTLHYGLYYPTDSSLQLTTYSDANWGSCPFSARSLTGLCVFLGKSLISWKTKKQKTVSKSSTEAEYRSMSYTTSEIVWLANLLQDLHVIVPKPIDLFCDNTAAQHIAENPIFHERSKHLDVDCHYVREHYMSGFLQLLHVKSSLQLADIMTKPLGGDQHHFLASKLGLVITPPTSSLRGGCKFDSTATAAPISTDRLPP